MSTDEIQRAIDSEQTKAKEFDASADKLMMQANSDRDQAKIHYDQVARMQGELQDQMRRDEEELQKQRDKAEDDLKRQKLNNLL